MKTISIIIAAAVLGAGTIQPFAKEPRRKVGDISNPDAEQSPFVGMTEDDT